MNISDRISGLVMKISDLQFTIKILGVTVATISGSFTVVVNPAAPPPQPLTLTPQSGALNTETVGQAVSEKVTTISGGTPPYTVNQSGTLPPGLTLSQSANADGSVDVNVNGTPTDSGSFSFGVDVTDSGA